MSKPSGFYPHSPDPVFHQTARAVKPSTWVEKESSSAFCWAPPLFFPQSETKSGGDSLYFGAGKLTLKLARRVSGETAGFNTRAV